MDIQNICIFTQSPISKAPRVMKEANIYARAGYNVTVYGLWYDQNVLDKDKSLLHPRMLYIAGINLLDWNSLQAKKIRLSRKLRRELVKWLGIESIGALGYDFKGYLRRLEEEKADLYIGHEEMSMALAEKLIKKGNKVAFDFEDWHSRDLLPKDRVYRPLKLIQHLERFLLKNALYTYTTSQAMALAMSNAYQTKPSKVIYNSFPASERCGLEQQRTIDRTDLKLPSLYWFSQVISEGRGLELLLQALQLTKTPCQLHLRGHIAPLYSDFLKNNSPSHVKLFIHDVVPYHLLLSRIAEHDLGIAFEEDFPENKNLTISNKIFHYLQAGIGVLATATAGQKEIAHCIPEAIVVTSSDAKIMATTIDQILSNPSLLEEMKRSSWNAGATEFAFEKDSEKLLGFIQSM